MTDKTNPEQIRKRKREANAVIAIGAGVGAVGLASAVIAGAVCPLCYFVAPGLMGFGAFERWKAGKNEGQQDISVHKNDENQ